MKDFTILKRPTQSNYVEIEKDPAVFIGEGKFVTLDGTNLAIEAIATSVKIAYCPEGAAIGADTVKILADRSLLLKGNADAVFAKATHKGLHCDIVVNTGVQEIDLGAAATEVLKVDVSTKAGTEGSDENISVRIAKHLLD